MIWVERTARYIEIFKVNVTDPLAKAPANDSVHMRPEDIFKWVDNIISDAIDDNHKQHVVPGSWFVDDWVDNVCMPWIPDANKSVNLLSYMFRKLGDVETYNL